MTKPFIQPDVASFLSWVNGHPGPKMHQTDPLEARRMVERMTAACERPIGELALVRDLVTPCGVPLRLFDARAERDPGPLMVYCHGGGFVVGDLDSHASLCAELARLLDMPVVSVDYRLAPEHPWPAAIDDAEAATRWIATSPVELGREVTGLVLAGDSAGGQLSIINALALRDRPAAVPVLAQWPIYPATSPSSRFDSFELYGDGYFLTRDDLRWFFLHYASDVTHWRATPIRLSQAGLPPTLVTIAELDPLADQGRAYAEQCIGDDVRTLIHEAKGTIHGFVTLRQALPSAQAEIEIAAAHLKTLIESPAA